MRYVVSILLSLIIASVCYAADSSFVLKSSAYNNGDKIPVKFTCDGKHLPPELYWVNPPANTQSYTLIFYTTDWPIGPLYLWVVFNIPGDTKKLPEGDPLPDDAIVGQNWTDENIYRGPCPPDAKPHHYVFELYAVDTTLSLDQTADADAVIAAMRKHILGQTTLMGTFSH